MKKPKSQLIRYRFKHLYIIFFHIFISPLNYLYLGFFIIMERETSDKKMAAETATNLDSQKVISELL